MDGPHGLVLSASFSEKKDPFFLFFASLFVDNLCSTQEEETKLFVSSLSSYFRSAKRIKRRPSSMSSFHDGVKAKFEPSQIKNKVGETEIVEQTLLVRGCLAAQPARPILTPPLSLLSLPPLPLHHHDSILSSLVLPLLLL